MMVVTGAAGFIGMHLAKRLLKEGRLVIGIDNINDYYEASLKQSRIARLEKTGGRFECIAFDLAIPHALEQTLAPQSQEISAVVHLAAQAGVRSRLEAPRSYIAANVSGTMEVLETFRRLPVFQHLVYASSSSVYGAHTTLPYRPSDRTDAPVSLYAATKKSGEILTNPIPASTKCQ